ncbi:hypothetical protein NQ317_000633 [Molorchus minor]|uniref:STAS domain-containing protein n=1 Tax=Molorchus minor TaxID=1323400 RepID=A0ABQ9JJ37_9CUCU|nr:hypothetical protein NQ317_000633 [Molorchus minor]
MYLENTISLKAAVLEAKLTSIQDIRMEKNSYGKKNLESERRSIIWRSEKPGGGIYEGENLDESAGDVAGGLPPFELPPFGTSFNGTEFTFYDMVNNYGMVIIFCPLVAILGHVAIAKAFLNTKGRTLDATQELIALGVTNMLGSFVHSMPVTGSFTRTAVNNASGVRTTAGGIVTGTIILLALGFLTNTFEYIPRATLAAVIIVAMYYLCDFAAFPTLWKTKKLDLIPLSATLFSSLALSLEYGILIGIATNMVYLLYASARPKLNISNPTIDVYVVRPKTGLYFAAAEHLRDTIIEKCVGEKTTVVIDGKYIGNMDATVAKSLGVLKEELEIRNQMLILMNFKKSVMDICLGTLEYGIFIGIAINMVFVLYSSTGSKLQIEQVKTSLGDGFDVIPKTCLHFTAVQYAKEQIYFKHVVVKIPSFL